MDPAFSLLVGGGVKFNRQRFAKEIEAFNPKAAPTTENAGAPAAAPARSIRCQKDHSEWTRMVMHGERCHMYAQTQGDGAVSWILTFSVGEHKGRMEKTYPAPAALKHQRPRTKEPPAMKMKMSTPDAQTCSRGTPMKLTTPSASTTASRHALAHGRCASPRLIPRSCYRWRAMTLRRLCAALFSWLQSSAHLQA